MNSYKINVQLFLGTIRGDNYDTHHADIVDQLIATDYYDKEFDKCNNDDHIIHEIEHVASEILKLRHPTPTVRKIGKYIQDNNLDYEYALNIVDTITHSGDISQIEYSFDPLKCILSVQVNSPHSKSEIKKMIMEDSLEDGLFEGCVDIGKGYDYYHPFIYMDKSDKANKIYIYMGTIDYRKESTISVERL
jgi:hypothetical protein